MKKFFLSALLLSFLCSGWAQPFCEEKLPGGLSNPDYTPFRLLQNYPNPVKEKSTVIRFHLNCAGAFSMELFDMLGTPVSTLVDGMMQPGMYTVEVDIEKMPDGIYFYVLKKEHYSQTMKLIVSREK